MPKRHAWQLVSNPEWSHNKPPEQPFTESGCCDHSHFITVQCRCGEQMHMHESATRKVPLGHGIASRCHGCNRLMKFPPSYFAGAFAELRRLGWII